ncbi:MAG: hypothetical protein PHN64_05250 [Desulfovibrionaceae bacterium]|nr:hypothetical protein [Desulfovibrionaceae bacterium]
MSACKGKSLPYIGRLLLLAAIFQPQANSCNSTLVFWQCKQQEKTIYRQHTLAQKRACIKIQASPLYFFVFASRGTVSALMKITYLDLAYYASYLKKG